MINAKELRIGNMAIHTNENGTFILPVIGIEKTHITVQYKDSIWMLPEEKIDAIPLTESILRENEITRVGMFTIYGDNRCGFHISIYNENWIFIEYVHKLQNLTYELTGEELIISVL